eukprot:366503-Chlamydomonas_euryale.AAC.1
MRGNGAGGNGHGAGGVRWGLHGVLPSAEHFADVLSAAAAPDQAEAMRRAAAGALSASCVLGLADAATAIRCAAQRAGGVGGGDGGGGGLEDGGCGGNQGGVVDRAEAVALRCWLTVLTLLQVWTVCPLCAQLLLQGVSTVCADPPVVVLVWRCRYDSWCGLGVALSMSVYPRTLCHTTAATLPRRNAVPDPVRLSAGHLYTHLTRSVHERNALNTYQRCPSSPLRGNFHWANPGNPWRSTQIPRPPISIGVDQTLGAVGEVFETSANSFGDGPRRSPALRWQVPGARLAVCPAASSALPCAPLPHLVQARLSNNRARGSVGAMGTFWKTSRRSMKMPGKCATSGNFLHTSPPQRRPNRICP